MTRAYDMTAPEFLEGFLPRWRASLPTRLAPFAERFLRLNRGVLEVLTQRALAALRASGRGWQTRVNEMLRRELLGGS